MMKMNDFRCLNELLKASYANSLPEWVTCLPSDLNVSVHSYKFGEEISRKSVNQDNSKYKLNIVLNGEVEIFDQSRFDNVLSYRPIRIVRPGEVFGDFELIDKILACDALFDFRETWKLVAGRRCLLSTKRLDPELGFSPLNGEPTELYELLEPNVRTYNSSRHMPTIYIVTLEFNNNSIKKGNIINSLLPMAWIKAKAYRDSINAFNLSSILDFRYKALNWEGGEESGKKNAQVTEVLPIFCDAVFDAITRPIAKEPLYHKGLPTWCKESGEKKLKENGILEPEILSACDEVGDEQMYYPIDLYNFFISKRFSSQLSHISKANISDHSKKLMTRVDKIFPIKRAARKQSSKSAPGYYMDLVKYLIKEYNEDVDYPCNLNCIRSAGTTRPMLYLTYNKKDIL